MRRPWAITFLLTPLLVVSALLLAGAGVSAFVKISTGPSATATADHCEKVRARVGYFDHCFGIWASTDGTTGTGRIHGVDSGDLGRPVPVRIHDDEAYAPDYVPPIFMVLASGMLALLAIAFTAGFGKRWGYRPAGTPGPIQTS